MTKTGIHRDVIVSVFSEAIHSFVHYDGLLATMLPIYPNMQAHTMHALYLSIYAAPSENFLKALKHVDLADPQGSVYKVKLSMQPPSNHKLRPANARSRWLYVYRNEVMRLSRLRGSAHMNRPSSMSQSALLALPYGKEVCIKMLSNMADILMRQSGWRSNRCGGLNCDDLLLIAYWFRNCFYIHKRSKTENLFGILNF